MRSKRDKIIGTTAAFAAAVLLLAGCAGQNHSAMSHSGEHASQGHQAGSGTETGEGAEAHAEHGAASGDAHVHNGTESVDSHAGHGDGSVDSHAGHGDGSGDPHTGHGAEAAQREIETKAVWSAADGSIRPKQETTLKVEIDGADGKPVEHFAINHEKPMHMIVISRDLTFFNHIHPEYKGGGVFEVQTEFPHAGAYKLIADYMPEGGAAVNKSEWIAVEGDAPAEKPVVPDQELKQTVGGQTVELSYGHLMAGMDVELKFHIADARTGEPVTDLTPYMGAVGHAVIVSGDAESYLHVHPADEQSSGPDAVFHTSFPKSGVYKIWGQFQRNGQVFVAPFVIKVP